MVIEFFVTLGEAFLIMGGVYVVGHVLEKMFQTKE